MRKLMLNSVLKPGWFIIALMAIGAFVLSSDFVCAESAPALVNYQGFLSDAQGNGLTGTKKVAFRIYDSEVSGTLVWGPQEFDNVPVVNGRFNIILGPSDESAHSISDAFGSAERFLGITVGEAGVDLTGEPEIIPRQQILSVPFAFNGVPAGVIVMWSGSIASIPEGWVLCDGTNGTPDLRDRFIVGAGSSYGVSATGGSTEHNHAHSHSVDPPPITSSGPSLGGGWRGAEDSYGGHTHTHSMDIPAFSSSVEGTIISHIPPYYALAYIMKL